MNNPARVKFWTFSMSALGLLINLRFLIVSQYYYPFFFFFSYPWQINYILSGFSDQLQVEGYIAWCVSFVVNQRLAVFSLSDWANTNQYFSCDSRHLSLLNAITVYISFISCINQIIVLLEYSTFPTPP